jgi:NAD(P)-dependent dehydrogenase (short-subunit alcohol dehydrogenase family)
MGARGLHQALAVELGGSGIRVNTICPTFIETPMTPGYLGDQQFCAPKVGAAVFLASDSSSLMTGSSIMLDGGWTVRAQISVSSLKPVPPRREAVSRS